MTTPTTPEEERLVQEVDDGISKVLTETSAKAAEASLSPFLYPLLNHAVKMAYFLSGFDKALTRKMLADLNDIILDQIDGEVMNRFGDAKTVNDFIDTLHKGSSTKN